MPDCLSMQPSVQGEAAVGEALGRTLHRSDFMLQFTGEEDDPILLGNNRLERSVANVCALPEMCVVNAQLPAFKLPRFPMEEVYEREMPCGHSFASVVVVQPEKVAVVARSNLRLDATDVELLHPEFLNNLGQHGLNPRQNH